LTVWAFDAARLANDAVLGRDGSVGTFYNCVHRVAVRIFRTLAAFERVAAGPAARPDHLVTLWAFRWRAELACIKLVRTNTLISARFATDAIASRF